MKDNYPTDGEEVYSEKWGVIVNPVAGKRRLRKEWINIYRTLKRASIQFAIQSTEYPGHAAEISKTLVENGFRKILVIGGDGTINETVNGIYNSDIDNKSSVTLALIPYGTGNDWARYCGLNRLTRRQIVETLYRRKSEKVDVCLMQYSKNGKSHSQYFINYAGFGFDGVVVEITNRLKRIFGGHPWVYSLSVILAVFQHKSVDITIDSKQRTIENEIFSISIGNSCYSGGGLRQTDGIPTDGLFYITAIRRPTLLKIIQGLGFLFRGELFHHPLAETIETAQFKVKAPSDTSIETDGVEIRGDGKYSFQIIHHGLNMIVNR